MAIVPPAELEIFLNLVLSVILGGLIGMERERAHRPAGLRTNVLVCMGAAIYGMIASYGFQGSTDISRIIANIVVGVGFLGTGVVVKEQESVHGLTTAATIWVVAGLGTAIALKMYFLAVASCGLALVTLYVLRRFESH